MQLQIWSHFLNILEHTGISNNHAVRLHLPHCVDMNQLKEPEVQEKFNRGPVGFLTVLPNGVPNMGKGLSQWFIYCLVVGLFVAYVCGRTLGAGAEYLRLHDTGTIEAGKSADFVVLEANPLNDITNTRRIESVFLRGEEVDRAGLSAGWVGSP